MNVWDSFYRGIEHDIFLLKVSMLGCMEVDATPPYQTALQGISLGCLSPGFHRGMGCLVQVGCKK
jgi:hypothetical protein